MMTRNNDEATKKGAANFHAHNHTRAALINVLCNALSVRRESRRSDDLIIKLPLSQKKNKKISKDSRNISRRQKHSMLWFIHPSDREQNRLLALLLLACLLVPCMGDSFGYCETSGRTNVACRHRDVVNSTQPLSLLYISGFHPHAWSNTRQARLDRVEKKKAGTEERASEPALRLLFEGDGWEPVSCELLRPPLAAQAHIVR